MSDARVEKASPPPVEADLDERELTSEELQHVSGGKGSGSSGSSSPYGTHTTHNNYSGSNK